MQRAVIYIPDEFDKGLLTDEYTYSELCENVDALVSMDRYITEFDDSFNHLRMNMCRLSKCPPVGHGCMSCILGPTNNHVFVNYLNNNINVVLKEHVNLTKNAHTRISCVRLEYNGGE